MKVDVKLFAVAKQYAGTDTITLELDEQAATAGQLKLQLVQQIPQLQPFLNSLRIAVNQQYASDQTQLRAHDEIACIPPVSGG